MKNNFARLLTMVLPALFLFSSCQENTSATAIVADTIITNATIWTGNELQEAAKAFALNKLLEPQPGRIGEWAKPHTAHRRMPKG